MKGLEIIINNEKIFASSDCVVAISIGAGCRSEDNFVIIEGIDSKSYFLTWLNTKLKIGDKIKVRVTEIDFVTPVILKRPSDRKELIKRYYELKNELENY